MTKSLQAEKIMPFRCANGVGVSFPLLFLFLCLSLESYGQYFSRKPVWGSDTIFLARRDVSLTSDTSHFRAVECVMAGRIGLRADIGRSDFRYNPATASWLGPHSGASFGLFLMYRHVTVGARFKLATVTPKRILVFGVDTVQSPARINPNKFDYTIGYSFDFKYNFSIEPYIGYTRTSFYAVNDSAVSGTKEYTLPVARGLLLGLSVNKYFRIRGFEYFALFFNISYATTDYAKVDRSLDQGYVEYTYGLAYKGFPGTWHYKMVD